MELKTSEESFYEYQDFLNSLMKCPTSNPLKVPIPDILSKYEKLTIKEKPKKYKYFLKIINKKLYFYKVILYKNAANVLR